MSKYSLRLFAVVLFSIAAATAAFAAESGQTQPKLSLGTVGNGTSSPQDIVGLTTGSGNVKDVVCTSISYSQLTAASIQIFVDSGSQQTLSLSNAQILEDNSATQQFYTDIPMNVRFGSNIRVKVAGNQSGAAVSCSVSWALD